MRKLVWIAAGIMIASMSLPAQQGSGDNAQASNQASGNTAAQPATTNWQMMGQGRGGAPFAWNDKDKDGICDVTGQPIGQVIGRGRGTPGRMAAIQNAVSAGAVGTPSPVRLRGAWLGTRSLGSRRLEPWRSLGRPWNGPSLDARRLLATGNGTLGSAAASTTGACSRHGHTTGKRQLQ